MLCPSCQHENPEGFDTCFKCGKPLVVSITVRLGSVIAGRYEVRAALGRGGMGMVYLAHDRTLDEAVAIKLLRPDTANDPEMARRFLSEIKLARRITHKNVCRIHEYGEHDGVRYICMEYVEGVNLRQIIAQRGAFPADEAFEIAIQVALGLDAIHDVGVVHRDLKTANIMRDPRGNIRLMDFGIAKQVGMEGTSGATATGLIVGTPEYMSPEQARGEKIDHRSDLYALGIVAYEIFTGAVPFRADTPVATILKHFHELPRLDVPGIPPALAPVLGKALAKAASDRYESASEMAEALVAARAVTLPAPTFPAAPKRPIRSGPPTPPTSRAIAPTVVASEPPTPAALLAAQRATPPTERVDTPTEPEPIARPPEPGGVTTVATPKPIVAAQTVVGPPPTRMTRHRGPGLTAAAIAVAGVAVVLTLGLGWWLTRGHSVAVSSTDPLVEPAGQPDLNTRPADPPSTPTPRAATPTPLPAPPTQAVTIVQTPEPTATPRRDRLATPTPTTERPTLGLRPLPAAPTPAATPVPPPTPNPTPVPAAPTPTPRPTAAVATPIPPQAQAPVEQGSLRVTIVPAAELVIDGKSMGRVSTQQIALSAGPHTLRVLHPDYQPLQRRLTITAGRTSSATFDLAEEAVPKK